MPKIPYIQLTSNTTLVDWFGLMVFNATFNNISVKSWWSEET